LPRLGIELPIISGTYDAAADNWTLSEDKAQFAAMTALPNNETGNTFIYGHNTQAVFAPLAGLQAGDEATVRTTNGLSFKYTFNGDRLVDPKATSILAPTEAPSLTLMTCEGIFSEARRVAVFDFKEVL
jgi:LPXTG-site transpeptidase (sortase) family protein